MAIDALAFALLLATVFVSAAVQGFTGFGFSLVGMGVATALLGPRNANVLWTMLALVLVSSMWLGLRAHTRWKPLGFMLAGAMAGVPLGVWVLASSGESFLTRFIGGAIIVFAAYSLLNPQVSRRDISPRWGVLAGLVGGFFSGVASMSGPPAVIFLLVLGTDKDETRGTLAAFFGLIVAYKLVVMQRWGGLLSADLLRWAALLCVPVLAGMAFGVWGAKRASSAAVRKAICVLLLVAGGALLVR